MGRKQSDMQTVNYCKLCHSILNGRSSCQECEEAASVGEYLQPDLERQIQQLFPGMFVYIIQLPTHVICFLSHHSLVSELDKRCWNFKDPDVVDDVTSGKEYANNLKSRILLMSKGNITLTINIDGVAVFQSSKNCSLLPVYLTVDELPPKLR